MKIYVREELKESELTSAQSLVRLVDKSEQV